MRPGRRVPWRGLGLPRHPVAVAPSRRSRMFERLCLAPLTIIFLVLAVAPAHGRGIKPWPYKKLLKEADLVVIATAKSTVDADDRLKDHPFKGVKFLGLTSTLNVKAVLKGKV